MIDSMYGSEHPAKSVLSGDRLVLRVKRKREDPPASSLYILTGNGEFGAARDKKQKISCGVFSNKLNLDSSGETSQQSNEAPNDRIFMLRSHTVSAKDSVLTPLTPDAQQIVMDSRSAANSATFVLCGKGKVESSPSGSTLLIEMQQFTRPDAPHRDATGQSPIQSFPGKGPCADAADAKPRKVLDPATRILEQGIVRAMSKGDFTELSSALIQGANPHHRVTNNPKYIGCTPLMAAAARGNESMVRRLLMGNTAANKLNLLARNAEGQTAREMICTAIRSQVIPLSSATESTHHKLQLLFDEAEKRLRSFRSRDAGGEDEDFVYDIFETSDAKTDSFTDVSSSAIPEEVSRSISGGAISSESAHPRSNGCEPMLVPIPGLSVASSGGVPSFKLDEQVFEEMAHDSDWSDLGDDEDPDSNDERFEGNDYPEELDDSVDSNDDDYDYRRHQQLMHMDINELNSGHWRKHNVTGSTVIGRHEGDVDSKFQSMNYTAAANDAAHNISSIFHINRDRNLTSRGFREVYLDTDDQDTGEGMPKFGRYFSDDEVDDSLLYGDTLNQHQSSMTSRSFSNFVNEAYDYELDHDSDD